MQWYDSIEDMVIFVLVYSLIGSKLGLRNEMSMIIICLNLPWDQYGFCVEAQVIIGLSVSSGAHQITRKRNQTKIGC